MLKVSFKDDFKKVETFNNKATVVTLTGKMLCPDFMFDYLPTTVWEWIDHHQSVEVSESFMQSRLCYIIKVSGRSVCADGDTFNDRTGERIAESRAKIKLYKFMHTLCKKLIYCYYGCIYGVPRDSGTYKTAILSNYHCGLQGACRKYAELWVKESRHLGILLSEE